MVNEELLKSYFFLVKQLENEKVNLADSVKMYSICRTLVYRSNVSNGLFNFFFFKYEIQ